MKRALLIASGTISGLGAVLAITPPQITSVASGNSLPIAPTSTPTTNATPAATKSAKPAATPVQTPTPSSGVTGTFTGDAVNVSYGIVQVKITVANGKISLHLKNWR